jgi:hypothetical protein
VAIGARHATPGQRVDAVLASLPPMGAPFTPDASALPVSSPWSDSTELARIVVSDVFGSDVPINTRSAAMRIPAVARSRNLLVSTICRLPMQALRGADQMQPQPTWLGRTNQSLSPQLRLAWTVDDLIFYGWSCWSRSNGADGFPLTFTRINRGDWTINADNQVEIMGVPQPDQDVCLIPGLHEGILSFGADALRDYRLLLSIVRQRLINPTPQLELHQTGGDPLTTEEKDALISGWAQARAGENGGVAYTNQSIETKIPGGQVSGDAQLYIEARNAAALDMARIVGVSAGRIDATTPKASLNYETTTGRNQELVDFDLALYLTPIAARLSLDDVVPAGTHVAFDLEDFIAQAPSVTGPPLED